MMDRIAKLRMLKLALFSAAIAAVFVMSNSPVSAIMLTATGNANPNANMTCNPSGGYNGNGGSVTCSTPGSSGSAQSSALAGHVGASADAVSTIDGFGATLNATAIYSDIVIFHDALNPLATTARVALNLGLTGSLSAGGPVGLASADMRATLNTFEIGHLVASVDTTGAPQCISTFAIGGCSFASLLAGGLVTNSIVVPLDTGVLLSMRIDVGSQASNHGSSSNADFGQSLDFPIGTPLFVLPDGVTANALDSFVIDNIFAPPSAVPGPIAGAGLPGLLLAWGGFLAWRHRRKQA